MDYGCEIQRKSYIFAPNRPTCIFILYAVDNDV